MRRFHLLLLLLIAALFAGGGFATAALGAEPTHEVAQQEHHLPLKPDILSRLALWRSLIQWL